MWGSSRASPGWASRGGKYRSKSADLPDAGFLTRSGPKVDQKLDHMVATGKDSIPVRPHFSTKAHHYIQQALFLGREFPLVCAMILAALAGLFALQGPDRAAGMAWAGTPLVLGGAFLAITGTVFSIAGGVSTSLR